ncbi:hypothetical protein BH23GEM10_BH23GEM10_16060 [soil metagenome]
MRDDDALSREWVSAFGHELRSPLAAILGYGELVHEGALGNIDPRAADAVRRMAAAAEQLIALLDGVDAAMDDAADAGPVQLPAGVSERVRAGDLIDRAVAWLRVDADSRDVTFAVSAPEVLLHTVAADALRALMLALSAAVKGSPNRELRVSAVEADPPAILIDGSSLDPTRDEHARAHAGSRGSGGALRLSLARGSARRVHGDVAIESATGGARITVSLPRLG